MMRLRRFTHCMLPIAAIVAVLLSPASAQLRIANWNTLDGPTWSGDTDFQTVLQAIGLEDVNGIARRLDIIAVQEQTNSTAANMAAMLNTLYGVSSYQSVVDAWSTSDKVGYVYDTSSVQLLESVEVSAGFRPALRGRFRPVGYTNPEAEIYMYSCHLKAGRGYDYQQTRLAEVIRIRMDADALPEGTNIIYAGDMNFYSSSEPGFQQYYTTGAGQASDPMNASWSKVNHTQDPSGAMDDRFDFQLLSGEMTDGDGVAWIPGSYRAFGNNGTHTFDAPITTGNWPGTTPAERDGATLNALASAADHLPVVVDYQLPAKMTASVTGLVTRVLPIGYSIGTVTVTNTASVPVATAADELDFTLGQSGQVFVNGSGGTAQPLGPGVQFLMGVQADTAGTSTGSAIVDATSEGTENPHIEIPLSVDVVDYSEGSFQAGSDVDTLSIDLGNVIPGTGEHGQVFNIYNLEATAGYTADLDLDTLSGTGDPELTTTISTGGSIVAGSSELHVALLDSSGSDGVLSATWTVGVSDEDLPGETTGTSLVLELTGYVAVGGDATLDRKVNISDLGVLAGSWGMMSGAEWTDGDFTGEGAVNVSDLGVLSGQWGYDESMSVPEPASVVSVILAGGMILARRRRQTKG